MAGLSVNLERVCPGCGRRMVFAAIVAKRKIVRAWVCDCDQRKEEPELVPEGLIACIVRAREFDDGSVVQPL